MHGVEEVANSSSAPTPGWAYVPDTGYDPSKAPIQPSGARKRARLLGSGGGQTGGRGSGTGRGSQAGASARQINALNRRLADLERDNAREAQIPVPGRSGGSSGAVRSKGKTTTTRKILQAQKTFQNYLADEEALAAQQTAQQSREVLPVDPAQTAPTADSPSSNPAHDSSSLGLGHGGIDDSHLLRAAAPTAPSAALMEALVTAPPLSFTGARAQLLASTPPRRHFCELCGYWGTIKCLHCGTRVCGLTCKRAHDQDRCQKYPV